MRTRQLCKDEPAILLRAIDGSPAKRLAHPTRLSYEGERLIGWQVWNLRGNGHLRGHQKLVGVKTC